MAPQYEPKELEVALDSLLPPGRRTGDLEVDLCAALDECLRRREENARDGGAVILAMRASPEDGGLGWSWTRFTHKTGQSPRTGRRWLDQVIASRGQEVPPDDDS